MTENIIANNDVIDKSKDRQLIYFSSLICELLNDIEKNCTNNMELEKVLMYDKRIQSLLNMKNKWVELFLDIVR